MAAVNAPALPNVLAAVHVKRGPPPELTNLLGERVPAKRPLSSTPNRALTLALRLGDYSPSVCRRPLILSLPSADKKYSAYWL